MRLVRRAAEDHGCHDERDDRKGQVTGHEILDRIEKVRNAWTGRDINQNPVAVDIIKKFYGDLSTRRTNYLTQVAQLYATERSAETSSEVKLSIHDYNKAEQWVIKPFKQLEKGMS